MYIYVYVYIYVYIYIHIHIYRSMNAWVHYGSLEISSHTSEELDTLEPDV